MILKRRTCLSKVAILAFCTAILLVSISPSQAQQDQSDARARKMLTKVVPIYPSLAQKMGIAGSVRIEVLVAPNGSAKSTQILGGHPVLAQAGDGATLRWFVGNATHPCGSRRPFPTLDHELPMVHSSSTRATCTTNFPRSTERSPWTNWIKPSRCSKPRTRGLKTTSKQSVPPLLSCKRIHRKIIFGGCLRP